MTTNPKTPEDIYRTFAILSAPFRDRNACKGIRDENMVRSVVKGFLCFDEPLLGLLNCGGNMDELGLEEILVLFLAHEILDMHKVGEVILQTWLD